MTTRPSAGTRGASGTGGAAPPFARGRRRAIAAAALLSLACDPLAAQGGGPPPTLSSFTDDGGVRVTYAAAGDRFLTAGYALSEEYWDGVARRPAQLRGGVDDFLPRTFLAMDHEGARRLMRVFAGDFFAAQTPAGLVPYAYDVPVEGARTRGLQPLWLVFQASRLVQWLPEDAEVLRRARALADATMRDFDEPGGGVWGWADAAAGRRAIGPSLAAHLGRTARGMEALSRASGDPRYARWAEEKLRWARAAPRPGSALLCGDLTPRGRTEVDGGLCDTDLLYLTQDLFAIARLTGDGDLRGWALSDADAWFAGGWLARYGHFARKLRPDGTAATDALYGDGKWNTLRVMVDAYRTTGDRRYLARVKDAWRGLRAMGSGGLAPDAVRAGRMVADRGVDRAQTNFLEVLLDAYVASGDRDFLADARQLGDAILHAGRGAMRMESGQAGDAFLRLAIASGGVHRVEVSLDAPASRVAVVQGGRTVVDVRGPRARAVVYVQPAVAQVRTSGGARVVSDRMVALSGGSGD